MPESWDPRWRRTKRDSTHSRRGAKIIATRKKTKKEGSAGRKDEANPKPAGQAEEAGQAFVPQYDVTSNRRYVDSVSQKSEFDKVLDELASVSRDRLSWDVLQMTKKHFGDTEEENNRKLEAFLGAFIVNAALELFDRGLETLAFGKLEQAKTILEAKRKLLREAEDIRSKSEEAFVDVSDVLGLSGDGGEGQ
ncbi:MAG: hypothetical protein LBO82_09930 [Synergistaceae bacterium]|nr:hypothetical protein [Synergistaceae bacterium]